MLWEYATPQHCVLLFIDRTGFKDFGGGWGLAETGDEGRPSNSGSLRECWNCCGENRLPAGASQSSRDEIVSANNWEDWKPSDKGDESATFCCGAEWKTFGNKFDWVELNGETLKVDLSEKDVDNEEEICSFGISGKLPSKVERSAKNKPGDCEDLGIPDCKCGNGDNICGDPRLAFNLRTLWELKNIDDCKVGVLTDSFDLSEVSKRGQAAGLLLEDKSMQKI